MIRSLRFTDLPALIMFLAKRPRDEARPWRPRAGEGVWGLFSLFRDLFSTGKGRHILVWVNQGRLRGLVSSGCRGGPRAWEVDLLQAPGDLEMCLELLQRMGQAASQLGVEKLFLRLPTASPLTDLVKQAGFRQYVVESRYRLQGTLAWGMAAPQGLRPVLPSDEYSLFRLFTARVPAQVREAEGLTFEEWKEARERCRRELVSYGEGGVLSWLRLIEGRRFGEFGALAGRDEEADSLVRQAVGLLGGRRPVFCLARDFQTALRIALEESGFEQVAEFSCLVMQLAARIREPRLVPLQA